MNEISNKENQMHSEYSVLRDISSLRVETTPFPHIVIKDALNKDLAEFLTKDFPINAFNLSKNNKRQDISASNLASYPDISFQWHRLIEFHSSKYFFLQIIDLFKDHLPLALLRGDHDFKEYNIGTRGVDSHSQCDLLMDAQISINSPVIKESSVRQIHVDNSNKLFSGLLYLRQENDDSVGGNLQLFSWNQDYTDKEKLKFYKEGVDKRHCILEKEIPYQNNICILFLNSINALHSVTPRAQTATVRTFVNLVGELPFHFYTKHTYFKNKLYNLRVFLVKLKIYLGI
jgi:hypothetical protein